MTTLSKTKSNNQQALALLVVATAAILAGLAVASARNVDGDEGFYALASRLTAQGRAPYLDFFYPQMPGLPYLYGLWLRVFGSSWASGRALSVILYALSALLLGNHFRTVGHSGPAILLLSGLYLGNGLVLAWATVIKTFASTLLILAATFVALSRWTAATRGGQRSRIGLLVAGLLFGFGIEVRLMLLPLLPLLLLWLIRQSRRQGLRAAALDILVFTGGVAVALLPALWLYGQSPWRFFFNNVGYHLRRHGQAGLVYDLPQKVQILKQLGSLRQVWPLLLASIFGLAMAHRSTNAAGQAEDKASLELALLFLVGNGAAAWLVTPSFTQYFCLLVPFAVVLIGPLIRRPERAWPPGWQIAVGALLLGSYLAIAPADARDELERVGAQAPDFRLSVINYVGQFIAEHTGPDAVIVSWWPGYALSSQRNIYPGMENHFSPGLAEGISAREGLSLTTASAWTRTASYEEILSAVAQSQADAVVVGIWQHRIGKRRPELDALLAQNYTLAARVYSASIYLKLTNPAP